MPRGGARPNSGPKKGSVFAPTIEKARAREALRAMVFAQLGPMVDAQIAAAKGIKYLVARDKKSGKFTKLKASDARLTPEFESESEIIEIWEESPSTPAFKDLADRTMDRPTEHIEMEHSGTVTLEERIKAARERARGAK